MEPAPLDGAVEQKRMVGCEGIIHGDRFIIEQVRFDFIVGKGHSAATSSRCSRSALLRHQITFESLGKGNLVQTVEDSGKR